MTADLFANVAAEYAAHRPSYPRALIVWLAEQAPARRLAWDAGTGSGQAAVPLAEEFAHVVATDASERQIAHARTHPRVEYRHGRESESGLSEASCDMVTAAQAAHWFDLPAFYREADRVLRPGGVLAIWGYALIQISAEIDPIVTWFEHKRLGRHWPPGRELATGQYRTLAFPYARIEAPAFVMERHWTREQFTSHLRTWSAVERCQAAEGTDPIPEVEARLAACWIGDEVRLVRWPLHLLVGRQR